MSVNTVKYKVNEVARDFNLQVKDILAIFPDDTQKKSSSSLTEGELNIIFDTLTRAHEHATLEAYFIAGDREKKRRDEEALRAKQAAEKAEAERKAAAKKAAEEKAAAERKAAQEKAAAERAARDAKYAPKPRFTAPNNNSNQNRPVQNSGKPVQNNAAKPNQNAQKPVQNVNRPASGAPAPAVEKKPVQGNPGQPFKKQEKKQDAPKQRVEKTIRVVDTRTSNVDMSRYDDKVDSLVSQEVLDYRSGKQKIKKNPGRGFAPRQGQRVESEAEKLKRLELEKARHATLKIMIPDEIVVSDLAARMKKTTGEVVKKLMMMGFMSSQNDLIDFDTACLVAEEFGVKYEHEQIVTIEEQLIDDSVDSAEDLTPRDPVVTVMGHVDHGKTSLLDNIRKSRVTAGEAGGITQHIGAYQVKLDDRNITFIDTPGHAAFTEMRARGANVTDIVILVVAADDGIMPQTVEAINHSKAAGVSIIVAINKMDKPTANPDKVKQELTEHGIVPEEWGGDVPCVPVSALTGAGIDELLTVVGLTADIMELKANPARSAKGTVIEAKLDKGRGPVATLLVQNGTLRAGDIIIAGTTVGRVRAMTNEIGKRLTEAGPSAPVEIIGLSEVPSAGDVFHAVANEKMARELAEQRKDELRAEANKSKYAVSLDELFNQIKEGEIKDLNLIIKADVQGSAEALKASLEKLSNNEVRVRVIHSAVGAISESDIILASASNAIVIGFNVRPDSATAANAKHEGVDIRTYRIIYECIEEIEAAIKGMLAPKIREVVLGEAEVRLVYKISSVGTIAGCMVKDGKITRNALARVMRDGIVINEGKIAGLKRFKDDAKEVTAGFECGISLERFNDIKEGDRIEAYIMEEYRD